MVKKGSRKIITIPRAEDLVNIKKEDLLPKEKTEEEKLQELIEAEKLEEKERQERLRKFEEFKEYEKEKIEKIKKTQEEKFDIYQSEVKTQEGELPIIYGDFLNDISKHPEDGLLIKTYENYNDINNKKVEEEDFKYEVQPSSFQQSLKDFFKDVPATFHENSFSLKVEKIDVKKEMKINTIEKADTVVDFNKQVKELMSNRNRNVTPQSYNKQCVIQKEKQVPNIIIPDKLIPNRNLKVSSGGRNKMPTSRTIGKVSSNRTIL